MKNLKIVSIPVTKTKNKIRKIPIYVVSQPYKKNECEKIINDITCRQHQFNREEDNHEEL
jgi:hypothetical protein